MKLYRLPLGSYGTNCYVYGDDEAAHWIIVDPGNNGKELVEWLKEQNIAPAAIWLTHGHGDHIGAVPAVMDAFNIPVYVSEGDSPMLDDDELNLSKNMGWPTVVTGDIRTVKEGDTLTVGDKTFKVLETPGHTPGGVCYYGDGIVFVGDTLFRDSVGRTDFPTGSFEDLEEAIRTKLFTLPPQTIAYPGHGPETTISYEMANNPFVRA